MPPLMPAREVDARRPEDHHAAAGHVLAAVVAHALDHGAGAAVADGEPLAGAAVDVDLAAGRAVEQHVAGDDVRRRIDTPRPADGLTTILPPDSPLPR